MWGLHVVTVRYKETQNYLKNVLRKAYEHQVTNSYQVENMHSAVLLCDVYNGHCVLTVAAGRYMHAPHMCTTNAIHAARMIQKL